MSSKRAGRGHDAPSPAPSFPTIPRSLKHVISALPTSQFTLGHYTGTKLNGTMSDDQYLRFKRDASDYLCQFLTFFNKYPEVSRTFIRISSTAAWPFPTSRTRPRRSCSTR